MDVISRLAAHDAITALCVLIACIMIGRDWRRLSRLEKELQVEKDHRLEVIVPLLMDCKDALNHNTRVINRSVDALDRNSLILERILLEKI